MITYPSDHRARSTLRHRPFDGIGKANTRLCQSVPPCRTLRFGKYGPLVITPANVAEPWVAHYLFAALITHVDLGAVSFSTLSRVTRGITHYVGTAPVMVTRFARLTPPAGVVVLVRHHV